MLRHQNQQRTKSSLQCNWRFTLFDVVPLSIICLAFISPIAFSQSPESSSVGPSLDLPLSWDHSALAPLEESAALTQNSFAEDSTGDGLVITLIDPEWADAVEEDNGPSARIAMTPQETEVPEPDTAPMIVEEPGLLPGQSLIQSAPSAPAQAARDAGPSLSIENGEPGLPFPSMREELEDTIEAIEEGVENVAPLPFEDSPVARTITPSQPYMPSIPSAPNSTALALQEPIRRILETNQSRRPMFASTSPVRAIQLCWPYGVETQIYDTKEETNANGQRVRRTSGVNAIGALCWNLPFKSDQTPLRVSHDASILIPKMGSDYQQSPGQMASMLAMARVPDGYAMRCRDREWTVAHLITFEQRACAAGVDQSHRLIALSFYVDPQTTWESELGQIWSLSQVAFSELDRPIETGDSRVTDHLLGLSYALQAWRRTGLPLTEPWDRVDDYIREYRTYVLSIQSANGSWNERFFAGSEPNTDGDKTLLANAHILRWLIASSEPAELDDMRILSSISYVSRLLDQRDVETKLNAMTPIQAEGLLVGLHALSLYEQRYFKLFERPAPVTAIRPSASGSGYLTSPSLR